MKFYNDKSEITLFINYNFITKLLFVMNNDFRMFFLNIEKF